ncbi:MAG TPA: AbrB/MazE/SpoVT family DNA-binding domain-containing protein, partial [Bradyrhizobium sp.]|nr:AbrB/MazE/SpoVT family DNA-binding domain-containing protein [Bradyrhizobium sp.]
MTPTVTKKGQVTIPKPVRDHLGIRPGSKVAFRSGTDGVIIIERADGMRPASPLAELIGDAGPGMTT